MKQVSFIEAGAENFCCFKEKITLSFEENKVVLVTGPNGSGKTTMFDTIPYTFYGITSKGLRGDDVVNDEVEKNCHSWVLFKIGADSYKADRYCKHSKFGNTVLLEKNGVLIKKGHSEVLPEIERILVPQKLFMNTLLFSQKVKTFFTDLSDGEQKEIFRKVLMLDDFVIWYNECNVMLKELEKDQTELENEIAILFGNIETILRHIDVTKKQRENFFSEKLLKINRLKLAIEDGEKKVEKQKEKLQEEHPLEILLKQSEEVREKYGNVTSQFLSLKSSLETSLKEIKSQRSIKEKEFQASASNETSKIEEEKRTELSAVEKLFSDKIRQAENSDSLLDKKYSVTNTELHALDKEITTKKKSQKTYESSFSGSETICPICKQVVSKSTAEEFKKHYEEISEEILTLNSLIVEKFKQCNIIAKERVALQTDIKKMKEDLKKESEEKSKPFSNRIQEVKNRLEIVIEKLDTLEKEMTEDKKKSFSSQGDSLQFELTSLASQSTSLKEKIKKVNEINDEISKIEKEIIFNKGLLENTEKEQFDESIFKELLQKKDELFSKLKEKEEAKKSVDEDVKLIDFWKEGFSTTGIPSMLIDEAIPFMNSQISHYLDKIGGRYVVSFDTQAETKAGDFRDKVAVRTLDTKTKANSRKKLSGGQTRVVDIATILTLCDLQNKIQDMTFNIMLFDEIFDSLDDENIGYVSNLLRSLLVNKSIYIISHRQIDQIEADSMLKFY